MLLVSSAYGQPDTLSEADTIISFQQFRICKSYAECYFSRPLLTTGINSQVFTKKDTSFEMPKTHLLKVTGNILYDVNYRSRIDTPYADNDVYQHTLQTRLDILIKDEIPLRLYLTARFGNSPFFRRYTDLNFQFNPAVFKQIIKQKLLDEGAGMASFKRRKLDSLRVAIDKRKRELFMLEQSLDGDRISQQLAEYKEKLYYESINNTQSGNANANGETENENLSGRISSNNQEKRFLDSLKRQQDSLFQRIEDKRLTLSELSVLDSVKTGHIRKVDSAKAELAVLEKELSALQNKNEVDLQSFRRKIDSASTPAVLQTIIREAGMTDSVLPKNFKKLYALRTLGIGRSSAHYSELTVTGISITGLQLEYNPGSYFALAAGKVDYRFRDYVIPVRQRNDQYLALARVGKGQPEGSHLYFTYYTGRRQYFNASVNSVSGDVIPSYQLAGFSIELTRLLSRNFLVTAEVAKSTNPYYSLDSVQKSNWMGTLTRFSERKNEAYSVRLQATLPKTETRINAQLRYTGARFQSFSTFTNGASQLRWKVRAEQTMLKRKLFVTTTMEQNEYVNPFVNQTFTSSSVLFGIQAHLKVKKWPVLMVGYYPSYQLVKTGQENYTETRFYTFTGSAGYTYKSGSSFMSTHVVFSRFYNASADSGFVYYNASNYLINQMISIGRSNILFNASYYSGTEFKLTTLESGIQSMLSKFISAGAGLKWLTDSRGQISRMGYNASVTLKMNRLGDIQFMTDKGFLPGMNRQLLPNQTGRLTYFKSF